MKGKVSFYTSVPNVARFRSRVNNPSKELTTQIRSIVAEAIANVVNHSTLQIRAEVIAKVKELNLEYKSAAHAAAVSSVLNSFFDVIVATSKEGLEAITGESSDETEESEENEEVAPEEETSGDFSKVKNDDDFEE